MSKRPVTFQGVYINPGVPDIDNSKWHWYYDMSLLETMEIVCCDHIRLEEKGEFITVLGRETDGQYLAITYHGSTKLK